MDNSIPCKSRKGHIFRVNTSICAICWYNSEPTYSPEIEKAIRKHKRRRASAKSLFKRVIISWGELCVYCNAKADTADHLIPSSRGGSSSMSNLRPCCKPCNQSKADYTPIEWYKLQEKECPVEFLNYTTNIPRKKNRFKVQMNPWI